MPTSKKRVSLDQHLLEALPSETRYYTSPGTPPVWIITFDDVDIGDLVYFDEPRAKRAWREFNQSWNCTLMATVEMEDDQP